jgi:hypothetical protein
VLTDGTSIVVRAWVGKPPANGKSLLPDDMLVLDIRNGTVLRRLAMPDPVPGAPVAEPSGAGQSDFWQTTAVTPEGVLLQHRQLSGGIDLELMDPQTGS